MRGWMQRPDRTSETESTSREQEPKRKREMKKEEVKGDGGWWEDGSSDTKEEERDKETKGIWPCEKHAQREKERRAASL